MRFVMEFFERFLGVVAAVRLGRTIAEHFASPMFIVILGLRSRWISCCQKWQTSFYVYMHVYVYVYR